MHNEPIIYVQTNSDMNQDGGVGVSVLLQHSIQGGVAMVTPETQRTGHRMMLELYAIDDKRNTRVMSEHSGKGVKIRFYWVDKAGTQVRRVRDS